MCIVGGGAAAVVTGKHQQGIVAQAFVLQGGNNLANGIIQMHDTGSILTSDLTVDGVRHPPQPLVRFVDRQMDGGEGKVKKKRSLRIAGSDPVHRFAGVHARRGELIPWSFPSSIRVRSEPAHPRRPFI